MYQLELNILKRANRFRKRQIFKENLIDFASNDYLGLANSKKQFKKAVKLVLNYTTYAPKASMLVNGYHEVHENFEQTLAFMNGFEKGVVVGSGFLANMALIESLVRKKDRLFIDEEYHASGMMATKLLGNRVVKFKHNSADELEERLKKHVSDGGRIIIAVEGVYSMSGELCNRDIFELANRYNAILIVDEAHSSGVVGERLLGVFEYYGIKPQSNHIKMGTLGKAYGSYGAYILASSEIISFLENRAKPIIYSTAPSIFDTALALVNIREVTKNSRKYSKKIKDRKMIIQDIMGVKLQSLIFPLKVLSNAKAVQLQKELMGYGYLVGAIRQPTVKEPILRIIPQLGSSKKALKSLLNHF
jgi:8-amino-7-oxononanoate synthase